MSEVIARVSLVNAVPLSSFPVYLFGLVIRTKALLMISLEERVRLVVGWGEEKENEKHNKQRLIAESIASKILVRLFGAILAQ